MHLGLSQPLKREREPIFEPTPYKEKKRCIELFENVQERIKIHGYSPQDVFLESLKTLEHLYGTTNRSSDFTYFVILKILEGCALTCDPETSLDDVATAMYPITSSLDAFCIHSEEDAVELASIRNVLTITEKAFSLKKTHDTAALTALKGQIFSLFKPCSP